MALLKSLGAGVRAIAVSGIMGLLATISVLPTAAKALEAIVISPDQKKLDITLLGELYEGRGDNLSVETAPGADGISGRMAVQAMTPGTDPNWVVFALSNPTEKRIERILIARRYEFLGSRVIWPDLDAPRIAQVTPSVGFRPERIPADQADMFRLTLEPGATVTFIVELRSVGFPRLMLWDGAALGKKVLDITLLNGILLGIAGLLAIFLTAIFIASHRAIFPATALIAWSVVAYLCVDFGFWHKLFQLSAEMNAVYRAAAEAALAASIVIFLYVYLRVRLWYRWLVPLFLGWALLQIGLVAFSVIDARLTAGLARLSFVPIAAVGTALILLLSVKGEDRALTLLPTWMLFLVWLFGAAVAILGQLSGDIVVPALSSGLVLFVALLGFTVAQYALHPGEVAAIGGPGNFARGALALEASGASVWEWDVRRDEIKVGADVEAVLGYPPGTLRLPAEEWLQFVHAADREQVRLMLWTVREREGGELELDFRLRRADGTYLWYELRGQGARLRESQIVQCLGLMRDVTSQKRSQERLTRNAIFDNLTGLPNRQLFLDRVNQAIVRAAEDGSKPTVLSIDVDRLRGPGQSPEIVISDSMLLTIARRLGRHARPLDTLARVGPDQFAMLLTSEAEPRYIAMLAERMRRSLRSPMKLGGRELVLIGSIGIAVYDGQQADGTALVQEAELAMYRAKRAGADRIELFKPDMRGGRDDRVELEKALRQAMERRQIQVLYQPIMRLRDNELAGFEAVVRWAHPKLGQLSLAEFLPMAEQSGMISEVILYAAERAMRQVGRWHKAFPREEAPLFVMLDLSTRALYRNELIQDLRAMIGRGTVPSGHLWIEISEAIVMENPEHMVEVLAALKSAGASLALDDFGSGYSSLAYLHRLPLDMLKVDRVLIRTTNGAGTEPVVLRSVLAMSRELGLEVMVQGVDRERDAAYVRALGCEYGKGFYFGEPLTEKEVLNALHALSRSVRKGRSSARKQQRAVFGVRRQGAGAAHAEAGSPREGRPPRSRRQNRNHGAGDEARAGWAETGPRQWRAPGERDGRAAPSADHRPLPLDDENVLPELPDTVTDPAPVMPPKRQ